MEWTGLPVQQHSCILGYPLQYWTRQSVGFVAYNVRNFRRPPPRTGHRQQLST